MRHIFLILFLIQFNLYTQNTKSFSINDRVNSFIAYKGIQNTIVFHDTEFNFKLKSKNGQINKLQRNIFIFSNNYIGTSQIFIYKELKDSIILIDSFYIFVDEFPSPILLIGLYYHNDTVSKREFNKKIDVSVQNRINYCCMSLKSMTITLIRNDSIIYKFKTNKNYLEKEYTSYIYNLGKLNDVILFDNILIKTEGRDLNLESFKLVLGDVAD